MSEKLEQPVIYYPTQPYAGLLWAFTFGTILAIVLSLGLSPVTESGWTGLTGFALGALLGVVATTQYRVEVSSSTVVDVTPFRTRTISVCEVDKAAVFQAYAARCVSVSKTDGTQVYLKAASGYLLSLKRSRQLVEEMCSRLDNSPLMAITEQEVIIGRSRLDRNEVTSVLVTDDGRWLVLAGHTAITVPGVSKQIWKSPKALASFLNVEVRQIVKP